MYKHTILIHFNSGKNREIYAEVDINANMFLQQLFASKVSILGDFGFRSETVEFIEIISTEKI